MNNSLANLGDFFPEQQLECAIPGCDSLCLDASERPRETRDTGQSETLPTPVCEECEELFTQLQDRNVPCSRADCENSWLWTRKAQLTAWRKSRDKNNDDQPAPPQALCSACREEAAALGDLEVECEVEGCPRTWRWLAERRLISETGVPEPEMCSRCRESLSRLRDREIECALDGCRNKWLWSAHQQLAAMAANGTDKPGSPPRELCESCRSKLAGLEDRRIPCRVKGCQRTWILSAEAQLQYQLIHGEDQDPAAELSRMCDECHAFLEQAKPQPVECRMQGCRKTWIYSPRRQLNDFARGRKHPPALLCEMCRKTLNSLQAMECECDIPGCRKTWIWEPEEQLRESLRRRRPAREVRPPRKRCQDCDQFLLQQKTMKLSCNDCGAEVSWSPFEQLLHQIGTFAKPMRCSECATGAAATKNKSRPEDFIRHSPNQVFQIPARGAWQKEPLIQHRPAGISHDTLNRLEKADVRIITLGDELTASPHPDWPLLLEQSLNHQLRDLATEVAVANAGINETGSRLARLRLERDVKPFKPHLVIVSFVLADSFFPPEDLKQKEDKETQATAGTEPNQSQERLLQALQELRCNLLYWLPNPIFPQQHPVFEDGEKKRLWANQMESRYRRTRAHVSHLCHARNIPVLDVGARFEVNGRRSAEKWMKDAFHPNEAGNRNLANWLAETILHEKLLPLPVSS